MINAIAYLGDMDTGLSKPKKMMCDDGTIRVVKFNHPQNYNRSLFHELIGHNIAKLMNLPVLDQQLIYIPDELGRLYSHIEGMSSGIKVGSPFTAIDNNIDKNGLFKEPLVKLYSTISNPESLPGILVFDIWVHNDDRGSNYGNLLVVPKKDGSRILYMHDHGYAFFGPVSTMQRYKHLSEFRNAHLTWQDHIFPYGPVYEAMKYNIDISEENPFIPYISTIESIKKSQLESIMNEVPDEWQIPDYEKNVIVDFLYERRYMVKLCLDNLARQFWFPLWKGGRLNWQDTHASSQ